MKGHLGSVHLHIIPCVQHTPNECIGACRPLCVNLHALKRKDNSSFTSCITCSQLKEVLHKLDGVSTVKIHPTKWQNISMRSPESPLPTIMRLSVLALSIALPTASYHSSVRPTTHQFPKKHASQNLLCNFQGAVCCDGLTCRGLRPVGPTIPTGCPMARTRSK